MRNEPPRIIYFWPDSGDEECWKKVLPALILNRARELAAQREEKSDE